MKKQIKRTCSLILAFTLLLSVFAAVGVYAEENATVHVIVRNTTYAESDGAPWSGVLIDEDVQLNESDSVESVLERTVSEKGYQMTVSEYGYIASVNGLSEYAYNGNGGWMSTINNWFTADSVSAYTVENGGLCAGDEIIMMYTCSWGADVGSLYGDFTTTLSADEFGFRGSHISEATKQQSFVSDTYDYTIEINEPEDIITFFAAPTNKNYQARVYLNEYQPEVNGAEYRGGRNVPVKDGDVVYIGVGNPAWPTMNSWAGTADETVYTFRVKYSLMGDLNNNGRLDIDDVTVLQRHLAEFESLSESAMAVADVNGDGLIDICDGTAIQCILADYV